MTRARCLTAARRLPSLAVLLVVVAGCTRGFFRERADRDVEALLTEKSIDPRWDVRTRNWYVYPDPRARFADGDKPDHPKKPPDDPAAAALSPDPQPLRSRFCSGPDQEGTGYLEFLRYCDQHNRNCRPRPTTDERPAASLGNPAQAGTYSNPVPAQSGGQSFDRALATEERGFLITLEQAVELAQFNSRELQDRREDLYGSALAVTFQRFQFVPQLFAGVQATRTWLAGDVPGGPGSSWNINSTGSGSLLFPTGAQVVSRLANQLVVDLSTNNPNVGLSNLALSVTQPLLRGGGWAVTLEDLTQAERNLVYGVRSYARFRTNYFVYLAGGEDVNNAPYQYDGLGGGVFIPGFGLQAPSQGYLPTLLQTVTLRNEEENVAAFTRYLDLYREFQRRGDFTELQVGQVEQNILNSRSRILTQRQNLQNAMDGFKIQLGLPTRLPLELDEGPIRPIADHLAKGARAREEYNALRTEAETFFIPTLLMAGPVPAVLPVRLPVREKVEGWVFYSPVTRATEHFKATIAGRWAAVRERPSDQLRAALTPPKDAPPDWEGPPDAELMGLELALRAYEAAAGRPNVTAADLGDLYDDVVNTFIRVMNEARVERRRVLRESWPTAPAVVVDGTDVIAADLDRAQTVAAQAALTNRVELMNARAQVVDAWRQIAVQANSLLGVANVGYNFSTPSTPNANEPFALGGSRSTHQLVLSGELPLVRRAERNAYRAALIGYQRSRRALQATEDFILNDIRTDLRALRVFAENYRIQQRAVELAFDQVENSLDVLQAPPEGGAAVRPGQGGAGNAAALTQQLERAQNSLLQAQNGIYTVWVNYLIARMRFYRDIERLPLDPRGVWIDESCPAPPVVETLPEPVPLGAAEPERFADLPPLGDR